MCKSKKNIFTTGEYYVLGRLQTQTLKQIIKELDGKAIYHIDVIQDGVTNGATQEIVEMVENKGEVSTLEQEIVIEKTDLETLENSRENIQNLISESIVQIENNQGVTKELKDCYDKFTSEACLIYNYAYKSSMGVDNEEENLEKLSEIDKNNKDKFAILTEMFENQEKELLKELEEVIINSRKAEQERNKKIAEKVELKQELSEIEKEIVVFEEKKSALEKENAQYNNEYDVCHLKEDIIRANNEILDLTKKLKVTEEEKQKEESIILKACEESNEQLKAIEKVIIEKTVELQNGLTENEGMKNEITRLECLNEQAEKKIETLISDFKELEKNNEEYERNFNAEIENYKENLTKTELQLKSEKQILEKLTTDEETLKTMLKSAETDVEALKMVIHELEPEPKQDIKNELEVKENIAKKLKLKYETLNEEYKRRLAEKREEIEKDILDIETDNNFTETSIKIMEEEIKEMKENKMEEINKKKLELEKKLQELIKEDNVSKAVIPQKRIRNWDSDTTIEDEDTSYADKIWRKMKKTDYKK